MSFDYRSSSWGHLADEDDSDVRNAIVSMYSKPVNSSNSLSDVVSGNGFVHHWALVAHFEDDIIRTLEGVPDHCRYLRPFYKEGRDTNLTELRTLGRVRISPTRLRSIARDNVLNDTYYHITSNNCQDWACAAARELSYDIGCEAGRIPRFTPIFSLARIYNLGLCYAFNFSSMRRLF